METLDHPDPYSLEMLDPDPQHWNLVIQPTLLCLLGLTSRVLQPTGIRYGTVLGTVELSEYYYWRQCCGSEFFHPGSRVKKIRIPYLGSASNNLSNFSAKNLFLSSRKYYLGCSSRIRIFFHPGSWSQKRTVSRIRIRNTDWRPRYLVGSGSNTDSAPLL